MKDKTILQIITVIGLSGWSLLFRKGPIKDWFLVYLVKTFITALIDTPVAKKKLVKYPIRYFSDFYDTNIIFDYIIYPGLCVAYSQFTYKLKLMKTILSAFIFSVPMTVIQGWLERNTKLVKYSRNWSWFHTLSVLTVTFWFSRVFIASIRVLNQKRNASSSY